MNRLVALVMVGTLAALVAQAPRWEAWPSLVGLGAAILLAGARTVPAAVRLGSRRDPCDVQARLARAICGDHLVCLTLVAAVLILQLGFAR